MGCGFPSCFTTKSSFVRFGTWLPDLLTMAGIRTRLVEDVKVASPDGACASNAGIKSTVTTVAHRNRWCCMKASCGAQIFALALCNHCRLKTRSATAIRHSSSQFQNYRAWHGTRAGKPEHP